MKKLLILLFTIIFSLTLLSSCDFIDLHYAFDSFFGEDSDINESQDNGEKGDTDTEDTTSTPNDDENTSDDKTQSENDKPGEDENPEDSTESDGTNETSKYDYNAFTTSEKNLFTQYIGEIIPFAPNNEYYIEGYYEEADYEHGINFYTVGNTKADFDAYRLLYSDYELDETYEDEYGDTWYCYVKDDVVVDLSFYTYENETYIDVFVYSSLSTDIEDDENGGSDNTGDGTTKPTYKYTDFSSSDKSLFTKYIGEIIPFAPNNEYYIEGYYEEADYEHGINFYTVGNTKADFDAYRLLYSDYELDETYEDEDGDTWYCYIKDDVVVDLAFYTYENETYIDVFVYSSLSTDIEDDEDGGSDNTGGSGNSGNTGDSDNDGTDKEILSNNGAGLPKDSDGVYDVNLEDAEHVKDVTDQGYYLDGCPTVGSPAVLVIPVEFTDARAASKGYSIEKIMNAFKKNGVNDYYSVYDYYYISSYGQLTLDITVVDSWFCPKNTSSYYKNATINYEGSKTEVGDQMILNEALAYLDTFMDLSKFDSDNNGTIDSVVMINTLEIDHDEVFYWAYRYWNMYTDSSDEYYEYDGVYANDYLWASYQFLHEGYDSDGNTDFIYTSNMNTYTYIHEFGHILGVDDYYDTAGIGAPMDGYDVMDSMAGDHNAFTKFNLGWITTSRLVVTDSSITLTLNDFSKSGDTIIIANNWDPKLGAYQEYYILVFYTNNGLNSGENGYFEESGILVYHVNATLYKEIYEGETYYDVYNNNTNPSDEYGSEDNLIEYVKSSSGYYVYEVSDSLTSTKDDSGNKLQYTFIVDAITDDTATITFTKSK